MNKEKLIKLIPYILVVICVVFTLYGSYVLQNVENQCNTHLKEQYESFLEDACGICTDENPTGPVDLDINIPLPLR